ncbi:hypothetical protein F4808DRAFT_180486 [Astrocystis sublimbata]|nr:hypothetical protein F4808DRAFT_180486 [Astrocystis sublimbata]
MIRPSSSVVAEDQVDSSTGGGCNKVPGAKCVSLDFLLFFFSCTACTLRAVGRMALKWYETVRRRKSQLAHVPRKKWVWISPLLDQRSVGLEDVLENSGCFLPRTSKFSSGRDDHWSISRVCVCVLVVAVRDHKDTISRTNKWATDCDCSMTSRRRDVSDLRMRRAAALRLQLRSGFLCAGDREGMLLVCCSSVVRAVAVAVAVVIVKLFGRERKRDDRNNATKTAGRPNDEKRNSDGIRIVCRVSCVVCVQSEQKGRALQCV